LEGGKLEAIKIKEISLKDLKGVRTEKSVDAGISIMAKACGIKPEQFEELKQRDSGKINAVVLGFFLQGSIPLT